MVDLLKTKIFRFLVGFALALLFISFYIKHTPAASTDRGVFVSASWGRFILILSFARM